VPLLLALVNPMTNWASAESQLASIPVPFTARPKQKGVLCCDEAMVSPLTAQNSLSLTPFRPHGHAYLYNFMI
jgi:hypothetical protein